MANPTATPRGSLKDHRTIKHAHTAAVVRHEVLVINSNVCVSVNAAIADADNAWITHGPVEFPKEASLVVAAGELIYWDASAEEADKTNTNTEAGIAREPSAASDTTVLVELHPNDE